MKTFYCVFFSSLAIVLGTFGILKFVFFSEKLGSKFSNKTREIFNSVVNKLLKTLAIFYCLLMFLCIFLPDAFAVCFDEDELLLTNKEICFAIIRWFASLSFIMLPLAVFFKKKSIRNIAVYFCFAMTIVSIINYPTFIEYFTSTSGKGLNSISVFGQDFKNFLLNTTFRSIILGLQWSIELFVFVVLAVQEKHVFNFKNKTEYLNFFLVLIFSLICSVPIYVPQHLFGYSNIIFSAWSLPHIIWLLLVVATIVVLYYVFRNKANEDKMVLCFVLSLALLFQYNQMFSAVSISMKRMPFQLCNLGAFLILFSLITKNKHLFNFTVIVNVIGVLFALAVPDLDGKGLFYLYNMHFVFEHTNVLVVPVLALLFGLFPRLDKSALKDCLVGFIIYFATVLTLGTTFNAIESVTGNSFYHANYLFMFDQTVASKLIDWLGQLFCVKLTISNHITFYPIAQSVVFAVFILLCTLLFYAIQLLYVLKDKIRAKNIRNKIQSNSKPV